jgi:hypothetical protein
MRIDTPCALMPLAPHRPQRLRACAGARLRGVRGTTWVTIDFDRRDLVLEPGDEYVLESDAPLMLSALGGDALLKVSEPGDPAGRTVHAAARQWWLGRLVAARRTWSAA